MRQKRKAYQIPFDACSKKAIYRECSTLSFFLGMFISQQQFVEKDGYCSLEVEDKADTFFQTL